MLNLAASKALTLGAVLQVCKEGHNTKRQYIYFKKMNKSYNYPHLGTRFFFPDFHNNQTISHEVSVKPCTPNGPQVIQKGAARCY